MGGRGSGNRWRFGANFLTDNFRTLDVRRLARAGVLRPGYRGGWQWTHNGKPVASIQVQVEPDGAILIYQHRGGDDWEAEVRIVRTSCHLGGGRAWFICPAPGCLRRVAILYDVGGSFACRHCHRLTYASSREDAGGRAARRLDKLRERLGWQPGIFNGKGGKPKWMRWRTFERLNAKHDELVQRSLRQMGAKLGLPLA